MGELLQIVSSSKYGDAGRDGCWGGGKSLLAVLGGQQTETFPNLDVCPTTNKLAENRIVSPGQSALIQGSWAEI